MSGGAGGGGDPALGSGAGDDAFTPDVLVHLARLSEPVPTTSADGTRIAYSERRWHDDDNSVSVDLRVLSDGASPEPPLQLTCGVAGGRHKNFDPVWAPDGHTVFFLSTRPHADKSSNGPQVWAIDTRGGEAYPLTAFPLAVEGIKHVRTTAPAGTDAGRDAGLIAFVVSVYADCGADFAATASRDEEKASSASSAMVFEQLPVRHWDDWDVYSHSNHVFVQRLEVGGDGRYSLAGTVVDLMDGLKTDTPTKPFGGTEDFDFSPDGRECAIVARPIGKKDMAWTTHVGVWSLAVPLEALYASTGGTTETSMAQLSTTESLHANPKYSPSGDLLAALGMETPRYEADAQKLLLFDRRSGADATPRSPLAGLDVSFGSVTWASNSVLVATAQRCARNVVYVISLTATGSARIVWLKELDGCNGGVTASVQGDTLTLYLARHSMNGPTDLWKCTTTLPSEDAGVASGPQEAIPAHTVDSLVQLTHANAGKVPDMPKPADFYFDGALGDKVHSWVIEPHGGVQKGVKYPVALIVHGGPQGAVMDAFSYRWNPQIYAAAGYAVVCVNFHGSTGFGQAFCDSIRGNWGSYPFEDTMKCVEAVLEAHSDWMDADRVAALGASYGGYMMNWLAGHTDRFRCLVNHDGVFSTRSLFFSTEELWFPEREMHGVPWEAEAAAHYEKWDPSRHIHEWKTPMLVVQGSKDYRISEAEGLSTFTALQRRGIPSKLVVFPDENHWVLKAANSLEWHKHVLGWLQRFLKDE